MLTERERQVRRPSIPAGLGRALWTRLTSAAAMTRAEFAVAAAAIAVVAVVVFGSHAFNGGFLMDDWSNAAKSRYLASCCHVGQTGEGAGWPSQYKNMLNDGPAAYHLGLPVVVPVVHFMFGVHMGFHLLLAILLGAAMSLAAYVLMRALGLRPLHAGVIATLAMLFPWSDSLKLWAMAGFNQIAVVLWVVGLFAAFRGLRASSTARAVGWHALATAIYVTAILMYELVGGLVIASAAFYLLRRASWRQALVRLPVDVLTAYLALTYVKENTVPRPVLGVSESIDHARTIVDQAFTLLALAAMPFGQPARNIVVGLIAAALVAGLVALWRLPAADPARAAVRRWLIVAAAGIVVVGAGYITLAPAHYGAPLDLGIENRVNMVSAFGYVAIVYAAASISCVLLLGAWRRRPALAPAVALALSALIAIGYLARIDTDKDNYARAYNEGQLVLDGIGRATGGKPQQRLSDLRVRKCVVRGARRPGVRVDMGPDPGREGALPGPVTRRVPDHARRDVQVREGTHVPGERVRHRSRRGGAYRARVLRRRPDGTGRADRLEAGVRRHPGQVQARPSGQRRGLRALGRRARDPARVALRQEAEDLTWPALAWRRCAHRRSGARAQPSACADAPARRPR